jgi:flagellar basal-body rod protein FlgG
VPAVSNSQTAGYKQDSAVTASFGESLALKLDGVSQTNIGNIGSGQAIDDIRTDFEQGPLKPTGGAYDLAISGDGFFSVQDTDGTVKYTRNGEFRLNGNGYIVNSDGALLVGSKGAIYTGGGAFSVSSDGKVYAGGVLRDKLRIYNPAKTDTMEKQDNGLFTDTGGNENAFTGKINQGYLEDSNVYMIDEMMEMINSKNTLQSCSQVLKMIDETIKEAVQLGRMI